MASYSRRPNLFLCFISIALLYFPVAARAEPLMCMAQEGADEGTATTADEGTTTTASCGGMFFATVPSEDLLPSRETHLDPSLEPLHCGDSGTCGGTATIPALPTIDLESTESSQLVCNRDSCIAMNTLPAKPVATSQAEPCTNGQCGAPLGFPADVSLSVHGGLESYLIDLVSTLVFTSHHLSRSQDFQPYFGKPRLSDGVLGKYSSIAVVIPSEVFDSEEIGAWVAFDVSLYHEVELRDGELVRLVFVDKSRAAGRSFFGTEKAAPSPLEIYASEDATFSIVDDRDKRIAQVLGEAARLPTNP